MRKIINIGLAVLLSVFLGGMISQSYAISADFASPTSLAVINYHETVAGADSYALNREEAKGLSISPDFVFPTSLHTIAYQKAAANCPTLALNEEGFIGPVVSSENGGVMRGTDDAITLVAMLCE